MPKSKQGTSRKAVTSEVQLYRDTLKANKRIAKAGAPLPPGATHVEERDAQGNLVPKRKRFSAI
jgi:hypothetical protein